MKKLTVPLFLLLLSACNGEGSDPYMEKYGEFVGECKRFGFPAETCEDKEAYRKDRRQTLLENCMRKHRNNPAEQKNCETVYPPPK